MGLCDGLTRKGRCREAEALTMGSPRRSERVVHSRWSSSPRRQKPTPPEASVVRHLNASPARAGVGVPDVVRDTASVGVGGVVVVGRRVELDGRAHLRQARDQVLVLVGGGLVGRAPAVRPVHRVEVRAVDELLLERHRREVVGDLRHPGGSSCAPGADVDQCRPHAITNSQSAACSKRGTSKMPERECLRSSLVFAETAIVSRSPCACRRGGQLLGERAVRPRGRSPAPASKSSEMPS